MAPLGWLHRHSDRIYALFRIVTAFLYACHGAQKLFGVLGGRMVWGGPALPIVAGFIEFGAGTLILLGWQASLAAFLASGEMAVAYFKVHLPQGFFPILNHGEDAAFYCFAMLFIASRGSGVWSIDSLLSRGRG
ncbi:MAG TPA: DoxX family protein [Gemmatimonadales bacterium]|nr:DoxX family protein [Gemmatimonadales bacterium]